MTRLRLLLDERANMAVEFAMLAPVMMTLLLGVADWSIVARDISELRAAARAGLQAVLANADDLALAISTAEEIAPDATVTAVESCKCSNGSDINCASTCPTGTTQQRWVTVTASGSVTLLFPWPGVDDPFDIEGVAKARVE